MRHLVVGGVAGVAVVVLVTRLPVLVGVCQVRVLLVRVAVAFAEAVRCGAGGARGNVSQCFSPMKMQVDMVTLNLTAEEFVVTEKSM